MSRLRMVRDLIRSLGPLDGLAASLAAARRRPVPVGDLGLIPYDRSAAFHAAHSTEKLRRLASYVSADANVLDVGAHAGLFSVLAARRGAHIVAVEPDPIVVAFLRENTADLDVEVIEAAVAADAGPVTFWRVTESTQTSSLSKDAAETFGEATRLEVEAVTLDSLVDKYGPFDVVKLDIQGLESALPIPECRVLLVEISDLEADAEDYRKRLVALFGEPEIVNEVHGGFDLAFARSE